MFGNLDDPQKQLLLMLGAGLLSPVRNKGFAGFGEALGQGIQGGLLGYNQARQMQDGRGQEDMRRKFQEAQLSQMNQANADRDFMRQSAGQFFQPQNAPADGMGPVAPPKMDFAGYGQALASRGMVNEALPFMPRPEAPKAPIKLGQNERLIDPNTFKETVSAAPENWQNPEWVKTQQAIRRAGAPSVSVNTGTQENAFSKEYGKSLAENYSNLMKGDLAASSTLNNLSRLESLLKSSGQTGPLAPTLVNIQAVAKQLGITDPDVVNTTDYAKASAALSNQLALELRNPSGGAGMPGALSDKDREFLVGMTAGIHQLPNANAMVIETRRRMAKREKEVAKLAREYRKRTGRFDEGFYDELAKFSEANPLFGDLISQTGAANDTQALVDEARRRGLVK